jgi:hypothetical protein
LPDGAGGFRDGSSDGREMKFHRQRKPTPQTYSWGGRHYLITRNEPARYQAMAFGFDLGTYRGLDDALAAVLRDYEDRFDRLVPHGMAKGDLA